MGVPYHPRSEELDLAIEAFPCFLDESEIPLRHRGGRRRVELREEVDITVSVFLAACHGTED